MTAVLAGPVSAAETADTMRLDALDRVTAEVDMPPGWRLRAVGGERAPEATVESIPDGWALRLRGAGVAGQCWLELHDELPAQGGRLLWRWRIARHLSDADLRDPSRDDSPARLFVVFGNGGLFSAPRMLFYSWGGSAEVGESFPSHVSDRLRVVVVRNRRHSAAEWHEESRDVAADYRRAFGAEPPPITAVGLMLDTDQLGGNTGVDLARLSWIPSDAPAR